MPAPPKYRCAVLSVVKHAYVPQGVAAHPRFELVVVADDADQPDWVHERNQKFADQYKIPYVRNVESAIAEYKPHVAVVSSQVERHCDLSIRAIQHGLHVIQDKPMSQSLAECDRLLKALEQQRVKFLMWNRNFLPAVLQARELVAQGAIGKPYAVHVDFYFAKDAGPPKGTRPAESQPMDWQQHQRAAHADGSDGGLGVQPLGELQIEGIYPLAYIRMLTGASVRRVFARTARHFHQLNVDNDIEDLGSLSLEMDQGLTGTLCIGRIGKASHPDIGEIKLHLLGERGGLVISEARPEVAIYYRGQPAAEFRHRRVALENDYRLLDNFLQAIENDGETILDAAGGRAICATVAAALESARTGKCVKIG
jgi:predicted dehydrogenase